MQVYLREGICDIDLGIVKLFKKIGLLLTPDLTYFFLPGIHGGEDEIWRFLFHKISLRKIPGVQIPSEGFRDVPAGRVP